MSTKTPMRSTLMRGLLTPSPLYDHLRPLDILACVMVLLTGLGVRMVWDSNWALLAFPCAIAAGRWTRRHVPDFDEGGRTNG